MKKNEWMLLVQTSADQVSNTHFETATAAEAAAYIAKVADPDAKVSIHFVREFGLLWERGAWHVLALDAKGPGVLCKRVGDFAAALCEHNLLWQAAASGATFFR